MKARGDLPILKRIEEAPIHIGPSLIEGLDCPLKIIGQDLVIVIEGLVELRIALLNGLSMQPAAVLNIGLESSTDQRQVITLGQFFSKGPGTVDQKNCPEIPVSLGGYTVDRIIEEGGVYAFMNTNPHRHTGILILKSGMSQVGQYRAVGTRVIGPQGKPIDRGQALDRIELGSLENRPVCNLGQPLGIIIPINEIAILSILDEIRDSTGLRHYYRYPTAESFSSRKQEPFLAAVTQQDVTTLQTVSIAHRVEIEGTDIQTVLHSEFAS